ncbi:Putative sugar kinase YoaC [Bacillus subtilis subsp. subtilis]|nr:Putative sugar kinase YoaC [Bacillus subtilis subsp. subtilis]ASB70024.1 Putative sugar kinase YoaC [Bacillus subtilis subsp. subtilis]POD86323.1 putative sugar kinase YoaC [Bacillus subtilis subsp. subtilis]
MEEEISALAKEDHACVAALGSYLSAEKNALTRGGFLFDAPLSAHLKRAHFVRAALEEIAFSIKWNFDILTEVTPFERDYVWVCGGGFQSKALTQYIADLLQKKVYVQEGYHQASVVGAAVICNETFQLTEEISANVRVIEPKDCQTELALYEKWKQTQRFFSGSESKVLI